MLTIACVQDPRRIERRIRGIGEGYVASLNDEVKIVGGINYGLQGTIVKIRDETVAIKTPTRMIRSVKKGFLSPIMPESPPYDDRVVFQNATKLAALSFTLEYYIRKYDESYEHNSVLLREIAKLKAEGS